MSRGVRCAPNEEEVRRVAQRTEVQDFTYRFLCTLSNTLTSGDGFIPPAIASTVCQTANRMLDTDERTRLRASEALMVARKAVRHSNEAYLQLGISMLWCGDLTEADDTLLYPSSAHQPGAGSVVSHAQVVVLENMLKQTSDRQSAMDALLKEHAPYLFTYLLRVNEIGAYVLAEEANRVHETRGFGSTLNWVSALHNLRRTLRDKTHDEEKRVRELHGAIVSCLGGAHDTAEGIELGNRLITSFRNLVGPDAKRFIESTLPVSDLSWTERPTAGVEVVAQTYGQFSGEFERIMDLDLKRMHELLVEKNGKIGGDGEDVEGWGGWGG